MSTKGNGEPLEVRTTSKTGGQKGQKLARFSLIPVEPLRLLAEHYGKGAIKYEDDNWRLGYDWKLNYDAIMRHLTAFWGGEDIDPETGSPHMIAVAWHAFTLVEFMTTHPEFDTRVKIQRTEEEEEDFDPMEIAQRETLRFGGKVTDAEKQIAINSINDYINNPLGILA